ncbi:MAG: LysR substrate-binding domain-containing protein [candidate division KSB1 bacterium]|nr:LysR substrate-binding domain-containing protein [candidate division KSB1 bacterium]MDZ7288173.1 LysR substrate-binding domain-containing protein [candidate division KSB1 bacterium]MDZ7300314.1 LysR substrate-binding domain-containing protein [candidate division KSB1 bacterium]MDZ7308680.1 LysR substrate-binding domain-containing protein [candidate division KSB1 bacterium]MDZ7351314.1 LysR substrate-binding domain-containing protein [candidate division KSB1 bacterium]
MSYPPPPFTLRQLQYAVAVAESLSFCKAAENCHVSQPSLSAQLAQLEEVLGVRLFERNRRRVIVTAAGREIIARARMILGETGDLLEFAHRSVDPLAGVLRIGVISTLSPYFLPRLTAALRKTYPQLTVLWTEDKTGALMRSLNDGTLDAVLLALEAEIGIVEHEIIGTDPFVLATPVGHPLGAKASPARAAELKNASVLLLDEGHCFREQALAFCANARARELEFRATSLSTLAQMVAGGAGVTLLPAIAVATETKRAELKIRPFAQPAPSRTVALAWRYRSPLGPALRQLAGTARTAFNSAPPVSVRHHAAEKRRQAGKTKGKQSPAK